MNFKEELITLSAMVDDYLLKHFDNLSDNVSEKKLIEAMRYSIMGGGKRIRPVLTLAIAKMMSKDVSEVMPFAAAIEMIHTYSLIHDDLPAMDNDDYRRGKLTNHKVFGVAMAILAGDALLNEAFELLLKSATQSAENAKQFAEASLFVATAAGKQGMIAGQVIDMESEGKQTTETTLKDMHKKKTGALIKASILAPAICLGASSEHIKALNNYSENIGVAFQIKDDILDVESTTEELGKAIGSDAKNKKTTYVSLYGLEGAKTMLNEVTQRAINDIDIFGERAWFLKEIAYYKFTNGELNEYIPWMDTDGNIINASDGGMIHVDDTYYWYGMSLRPLPAAPLGQGGQTTNVGVVMYSSKDLYNWTYEGVILHCSTHLDHPLYGPMRFERPKIVYNEKTKNFVLWCHYVKYPGDHGFDIGTAEAGVASCSTVNGQYEWHGYTRPIDHDGYVRDCTVYKDKDGSGYFIYDRHVSPGSSWDDPNADRCLHVVKLSDDYLSFTDVYQRIDVAYWREAASILYHNGYYFMFTSGLTSWSANPAKYFRAESLLGPWTDMGDPCVNDVTGTTFESQSTYVFPVEGKPGLFIHMAERHNTQNFERCSYIWLPIEFPTPDTVQLVYRNSWRLEDF